MPSDPTPTKHTEAEARESLGDAISFYAAFRTPDNRDVVDACVDQLAEAVRVAERERLAARVRGMDAAYTHDHCYRVRKLDVLRLLTEDTP